MRNMKPHIPLARNKADRRRKSRKIASRRVQKQGRLGPVCLLDGRDLGTFEPGEDGGEQRAETEGTEGFPQCWLFRQSDQLALGTERSIYSAGGSVCVISWRCGKSGLCAGRLSR